MSRLDGYGYAQLAYDQIISLKRCNYHVNKIYISDDILINMQRDLLNPSIGSPFIVTWGNDGRNKFSLFGIPVYVVHDETEYIDVTVTTN